MGNSTWIELEVKCRDERWPNIMKAEDDPHVTLAYLGKDIADKAAWTAASVVDAWLEEMQRLCALRDDFFATAYDSFAGNTTVIKLDPAGILTKEHQGLLVKMLQAVGLSPSTTYEFTPHVTVGHGPYVIKEKVAGMEIVGTKVRIMHKSEEMSAWCL
jgi:2'-5' RNA ligase